MNPLPMNPASRWLQDLPSDRLMAELSLWSADLCRMADDVARMDRYVDIYHLDVADGHFSPAMLLFPDLTAAIRKLTAKPVHVHLMVADAILLDQVAQFADAGADLISIHLENGPVDAALALIEARGLRAGLVAQLHTPVAAFAPFLDRIAMATLLGTRIGIKGQDLDPSACDRLRATRTLLADAGANRRILLAADGGIREHTVPQLRQAGAETIVMGSLAFGAKDLADRMAWVHAQPIGT
jgi:ribulose-phosphate 3-epimerase